MGITGCQYDTFKKVGLEGKTMGTRYHILYIVKNNDSRKKKIHELINKELQAINQIASTYIPSSELSLFNASGSTSPYIASNALIYLFKNAIHLAQITDGYLDVTVGSFVNLWGFGPSMQRTKIPSQKHLMEAKKKVGIHYLSIDNKTIRKSNPHVYVDLSTIAKGYGVDRIAELLQNLNIENYLVEIGGEMRLKGRSLHQKEWKIAIEKPILHSRAVQRILKPKDNAVATSGDYRIFYEKDDKRYSHLINPKTGWPIQHRMVSSTVIHRYRF
jgi:thiamine biosynthesis lipoprotein